MFLDLSSHPFRKQYHINYIKYLLPPQMTSTFMLFFIMIDRLIKAKPKSITSICDGLVSNVTIK